MNKQLIFTEGYNKYYKVELPDQSSNINNDSFNKLLYFIGTYRPHNNRNEIGSAYVIIRQRTDGLLDLNGKHPVLKTSKREIAAIRFYYRKKDDKKNLYAKIPFKIAFIFKAIVTIVEEIEKDGHEIPEYLVEFINQTYLKAFYKEYAQAYDNCIKTIPVEEKAQCALKDDFHGRFSPLNSIFK